MSMLEFGRVAEDGGHVDGRGFPACSECAGCL
jgi:hypothetical protein